MVTMARDSPTFFDKVGECVGIICDAACTHRVKMQQVRVHAHAPTSTSTYMCTHRVKMQQVRVHSHVRVHAHAHGG